MMRMLQSRFRARRAECSTDEAALSDRTLKKPRSPSSSISPNDDWPTSSLLQRLQASMDETALFSTPVGQRQLVYADWTATSRAVGWIEDYLRYNAQPFYGNTHTESSAVGLAMSQLRECARSRINEAVGGDEQTKVIFCGAGSTAAVNKLIGMMGLIRAQSSDRPRQGGVVFIGPYEHHSNELPWREAEIDVVVVSESATGSINLEELGTQLRAHACYDLKICSFSAASNVTGVVTDQKSISRVARQHGALVFFDCAATGPHAQLAMADADALFISPHKYTGGPATPGILVVRFGVLPDLFGRPPLMPGGGTVAFVTANGHEYIRDVVGREEAGTPDILGAIRAGLVFDLQTAIGHDLITKREDAMIRYVISRLHKNPAIRLLGNIKEHRTAIVSFVVNAAPEGGAKMALHHNYVVALLSDFFGVQARGGCSCAGPYGARLLNIPAERQETFKRLVVQGYEGLKPGWIRLSFSYTDNKLKIDYIIDTVQWIASFGRQMLPYYSHNLSPGLFTMKRSVSPSISWPVAAELATGDVQRTVLSLKAGWECRQEHFATANVWCAQAAKIARTGSVLAPAEVERERWYELP